MFSFFIYSMVPNNSAARLLIFPNFSLPTRLIWTYTLIKFQKKILPTRLLCTYKVIYFSLLWLTRKICYLLPITLLVHTASFWNIIIQWTSHDDLTEKLVSLVSLAKFIKWQKCKTALCDLTKNRLVSNLCLTSLDNQIFKSLWKPNPWMNLLEKTILLYHFLFIFCRLSPFHREYFNDLNLCSKNEQVDNYEIVVNFFHISHN